MATPSSPPVVPYTPTAPSIASSVALASIGSSAQPPTATSSSTSTPPKTELITSEPVTGATAGLPSSASHRFYYCQAARKSFPSLVAPPPPCYRDLHGPRRPPAHRPLRHSRR